MALFRSLCAAAALLLLSACAVLDTPPAENVTITVTRLAANDWQVSWRWAQPVSAMQFRSGAELRRDQHWQLKGGLRFAEGQDGLRIESADGSRFKEVSARFAAQDGALSKDYEFYAGMADEGAALYFGHLLADPVAHSTLTEARLILRPRKGEYVIAANQPVATQLVMPWTEEEGQYLYFGQSLPMAAERVDLLLDNHLPDWVERELQSALPALLAYYEKHLGPALAGRGFLLAAFRDGAPDEDSLGGGALSAQLQITLTGQAWRKQDERKVRMLRKLMAHEVAHWWVGRRYRADDSAPWLHEGGAEALALEALRELQWTGPDATQQAIETPVNHCLGGLQTLGSRGKTLNDAGREKKVRTWYDCGLALITAAALTEKQDHAPRQTLFWRQVFQDAESTAQSQLQPARIAALLDQRVAGLGSQWLALSNQPQADAAHGLRNLFAQAGGSLYQDESRTPADAGFQWGQNLMVALMAKDCAGAVNMRRAERWFFVYGGEKCQTLREPELPIRGAAEQAWTASEKLVSAVSRACQEKGRISVQRADKNTSLNLSCPETLPTWIPWHSFSDVRTTRVEALPW